MEATSIVKFFNAIGQEFPLDKWRVKAINDVCRILEGEGRIVINMPVRTGRKFVYMMGRKLKFWKAINSLLEHFNSLHPYDKDIIKDLIDGGMTEEEVTQLRDLTLKAAGSFYGKKETN